MFDNKIANGPGPQIPAGGNNAAPRRQIGRNARMYNVRRGQELTNLQAGDRRAIRIDSNDINQAAINALRENKGEAGKNCRFGSVQPRNNGAVVARPVSVESQNGDEAMNEPLRINPSRDWAMPAAGGDDDGFGNTDLEAFYSGREFKPVIKTDAAAEKSADNKAFDAGDKMREVVEGLMSGREQPSAIRRLFGGALSGISIAWQSVVSIFRSVPADLWADDWSKPLPQAKTNAAAENSDSPHFREFALARRFEPTKA